MTEDAPLTPYERWMVESNLRHAREHNRSLAEQAALLRANGYVRVAHAVEVDRALRTEPLQPKRLLDTPVGEGYEVGDRIITARENARNAANVLHALADFHDWGGASVDELLGARSIAALKDGRHERIGGLTEARDALANALQEVEETIKALEAHHGSTN